MSGDTAVGHRPDRINPATRGPYKGQKGEIRMLDKAEDQKERDQKESQEQHSSLADSRMMTITKFAWDEKVEQVRQLREENERLKGVIETLQDVHGIEKARFRVEIEQLTEERDKLVKALEAIDEYDVRDRHGHVDAGTRNYEWAEAASFKECQKIARTILSEIKGQGDENNG